MVTRQWGEGGVLKTAPWLADRAGRGKQAPELSPRTIFSMYIKFCRSYGEDKKDEASENLSPGSKLSVKLEGGKGMTKHFFPFLSFFFIALMVVSAALI